MTYPLTHLGRLDRGYSTAGEPPLGELLDDGIMQLLWRSDRLDPATARAWVDDLQLLVQRRESRAADIGLDEATATYESLAA